MQEMRIQVKFIIIRCIQITLLLFGRFIPKKKNRILFSSFSGSGYSCNPKYISKAIEKDPAYDIYWVFNKEADLTQFPNTVKLVKKHSLRYILVFLSARVIIDNDSVPLYMPIQKGQVFINTWHGGGAFKKTGFAVETIDLNTKLLLKENARKPSVFLSSSKLSSELVLRNDLGYEGRVLKTGMPRNDFLVSKDISDNKIAAIKRHLHIKESDKIVLYAPTFRSGEGDSRLDINEDSLLKALHTAFDGSWTLLVRAHHRYKKVVNSSRAIDVSEYNDMQELLLLTDVLITDYSSCMWDFSLLGKPCFILANDLEKFSKGRGFHFPINQWPFPIARSNEELTQRILNFDSEDYAVRIKGFFNSFGSYENGHASALVKSIIEKIYAGECNETIFEKLTE